jgi:hypothetical protein
MFEVSVLLAVGIANYASTRVYCRWGRDPSPTPTPRRGAPCGLHKSPMTITIDYNRLLRKTLTIQKRHDTIQIVGAAARVAV